MVQYSEGFKEQAVQKFYNRGERASNDISRELGITTRTLYNWAKIYANKSVVNKTKRRPQDLSAIEKFKAVMEFESLHEDKRGEYLRTHGLHAENIETWKKSMQDSLEADATPKAQRAEMSELKARNKELEKNLSRKDKALAETTALLVLKKKADLIWGTGENE